MYCWISSGDSLIISPSSFSKQLPDWSIKYPYQSISYTTSSRYPSLSCRRASDFFRLAKGSSRTGGSPFFPVDLYRLRPYLRVYFSLDFWSSPRMPPDISLPLRSLSYALLSTSAPANRFFLGGRGFFSRDQNYVLFGGQSSLYLRLCGRSFWDCPCESGLVSISFCQQRMGFYLCWAKVAGLFAFEKEGFGNDDERGRDWMACLRAATSAASAVSIPFLYFSICILISSILAPLLSIFARSTVSTLCISTANLPVSVSNLPSNQLTLRLISFRAASTYSKPCPLSSANFLRATLADSCNDYRQFIFSWSTPIFISVALAAISTRSFMAYSTITKEFPLA